MKFLLALFCFLFATNTYAIPSQEANTFLDCFDFGDEGKEPIGAPRIYDIQQKGKNPPYLTPAKSQNMSLLSSKNTLRLIVEDVRFTNYKCWDKNKNITGFDIELITNASWKAGYKRIQFILVPWTNVIIDGKKYLSLLVELNKGTGDAVIAGMSMTPERQEIAAMVGPIYKAGKKLMARDDNPKLSTEIRTALMNIPESGNYDVLRNLKLIVEKGTIRSNYFRALSQKYPDLMEFMETPDALEKANFNINKLLVFEAESSVVNSFVDSLMAMDIMGHKFDLVMIDTGSAKSLREEGKLDVVTHLVTGDLARDPIAGYVFGQGDAVSLRKNDIYRIQLMQSTLAQIIRDKKLDHYIWKWFQDQNAADTSWAYQQAR